LNISIHPRTAINNDSVIISVGLRHISHPFL
jgi:hypothetical protein